METDTTLDGSLFRSSSTLFLASARTSAWVPPTLAKLESLSWVGQLSLRWPNPEQALQRISASSLISESVYSYAASRKNLQVGFSEWVNSALWVLSYSFNTQVFGIVRLIIIIELTKTGLKGV